MSSKETNITNEIEDAKASKTLKDTKALGIDSVDVHDDRTARIHRRRIRRIQGLGVRILVFILAVWVVFFWIIGITTVPNGDMNPSLKAGDLIMYYRLDTLLEKDDVITFHKNDTKYVARIVAKGGDTIEISDDERVIVNGNSIYEDGIYYSTPRYEGFVEYPLTIGQNEYFVLVDMREGGEDSRYFGTVKQSEIDGLVISVLRRDGI